MTKGVFEYRDERPGEGARSLGELLLGNESEARGTLEDLAPLLEKLSPLDQDIFELYYVHRMTQQAIARIFDAVQVTIQQRLVYMARRLKVLRTRPVLTEADVVLVCRGAARSRPYRRNDSSRAPWNSWEEARIVWTAWDVMSWARAGRRLGLRQEHVRHVFLSCVRRLRKSEVPLFLEVAEKLAWLLEPLRTMTMGIEEMRGLSISWRLRMQAEAAAAKNP